MQTLVIKQNDTCGQQRLVRWTDVGLGQNTYEKKLIIQILKQEYQHSLLNALLL